MSSSSDEGGSRSPSPRSSSSSSSTGPQSQMQRYKGVRRRKWGKWVSEIRVPGSQERLWLGSYFAPEAAAVAHDIAYYCLREKTSPENFNFFPLVLPAGVVERGMSPRSVQKAATDAGMAVDAQIIAKQTAHYPQISIQELNVAPAPAPPPPPPPAAADVSNFYNSIPNISELSELDISVEDYL